MNAQGAPKPMTATVDHKTRMVSLLIRSCYTAQNGYRCAASAVEDETLKRLFEIYAQQRTRFAQELREYLPMEETDFAIEKSIASLDGEAGNARPVSRQESIRNCLEMDARNLALYKETLDHRALPTRAHFVIASQLALMQRVHDRMSLMLNERSHTHSGLHSTRIST